MRKTLLLLIAHFLIATSYGQPTIIPGRPRLLTKKERAMNQRNPNCFYKQKYSATQRLQFYPFNQATEIRLVSFEQADSVIMGGELPMKDGTVDYAMLKETTTLTKEQTNLLTDILFNRGYGGPFYSISESKCYNPKNAILFLNGNGKIFAFIEICFDCDRHRLSSEKIKAGDFCTQKYDYLKNFFANNGIEFGVKE